jgi:hypothetical protein
LGTAALVFDSQIALESRNSEMGVQFREQALETLGIPFQFFREKCGFI